MICNGSNGQWWWIIFKSVTGHESTWVDHNLSLIHNQVIQLDHKQHIRGTSTNIDGGRREPPPYLNRSDSAYGLMFKKHAVFFAPCVFPKMKLPPAALDVVPCWCAGLPTRNQLLNRDSDQLIIGKMDTDGYWTYGPKTTWVATTTFWLCWSGIILFHVHSLLGITNISIQENQWTIDWLV